MNIKCKLGFHNWLKDCEKCSKCGRELKDRHNWSNDCEKCSICGKIDKDKHNWSSDCEKCSICGKTRNDKHNWSSDCEKCSICGKTRNDKHNWSSDCEKCYKCHKTIENQHDWSKDCNKCSICGRIRKEHHEWNGCKCPKCGKIRDEQHDWNKDCNKCFICGKTRIDGHEWENCKCKKCMKKQPDVIDIDGNEYHKLTIGTQIWMKENLIVTHYRNGDPIPNVSNGDAWSQLETGAYCNYDNNPNLVLKYGRLYNWYAVIDKRNICPVGWHIPSREEWNKLIEYNGGEGVAGKKVKEDGSFSLLGGSHTVTTSERFRGKDMGGHWWTSTEKSNQFSVYFDVYKNDGYYNDDTIYERSGYKKFGFSVRCILDCVCNWDGCVCPKCGKIRDEQHDWNKDCKKCFKCGKERTVEHTWVKSKCSKCKKERNRTDINYDFDSAFKSVDLQKLETMLAEVGLELKRELVDRGLFNALDKKNKELAKLFIEKGGNVNYRKDSDHTLLSEASYFGQKEIVKMLLDNGAVVDQKTSTGATELMLAAKQGHFEIVKLLIDKGADIKIKDKDGQTAIMHAALDADRDGQIEILKLFIERGADVNIIDKTWGYTSLLRVVSYRNSEDEDRLIKIVKLLLDNGADVKVRNKEGETALMWAKNRGCWKIAELLENAGTKI